MKTIIFLILIAVISNVSAFAGSIPEDLMHYSGSKIFFAEVVSYSKNGEDIDLSFLVTKKVKGDVEVGEVEKAYRPQIVGDFSVKVGDEYLFTYFDENNDTNIFKVTSTDTATLKLENTDGDMWRRFEKYLNEGKYDGAKINGNYEDIKTFAEAFMVDKSEVEELSVVYVKKGDSYECQINKDDFFETAEKISVTTDTKIKKLNSKNGVYIVASDAKGNRYTVWMDKDGNLGNSAYESSSAVTTRYKISDEDYGKVCNYLPEDASMFDKSNIWMILIFAAVVLTVFAVIKKNKK